MPYKFNPTTGQLDYIRSTSSPIYTGTTTVVDLQVNENAYFDEEVDNGNSGTTQTVTWGDGNKQKVTLTGDCTFTFSDPHGPCSIILKMVQDGTGSRTVTWPASVKWPDSTAPTLTTTAGATDLITFYFDGTNYHGNFSLNYS